MAAYLSDYVCTYVVNGEQPLIGCFDRKGLLHAATRLATSNFIQSKSVYPIIVDSAMYCATS